MLKSEFIEIMTELEELSKAEERLSAAFKALNPDFNCISFSRHETLILRSLAYGLEDTYEWLTYWVYSCDYGKRTDFTESITDADGNALRFSTLSDVYDLITNKK